MKIKNATLLNIDCMEYMKGLSDKCFDLAIVDPPYGIGEGRNVRGGTQFGNAAAPSKYYGAKDWDKSAPADDYFIELERISKNQIIWGANHFVERVAKGSPCWIVWDKMTGANGYADCELAYTSFATAVRKFSFQWAGMLQGDMKNKEERIHPTQKPVKLYEWLLTNYAKPGQRILDTHGGSMSSVIAANNLGFEIVCCELDQDYYQTACERVAKHAQQERLF